MNKRIVWQLLVCMLIVGASAARAGTVGLYDWCFNNNGDTSTYCNGGSSVPAGFDATLEPPGTDTGDNSLGSAAFPLTAGQFVSFYASYDVDFETYGSFQDEVTVVGSLPGGWSFFIDDPNVCSDEGPGLCGYSDLFDAFAANTLNNTNLVGPGQAAVLPDTPCCDVGWDLSVPVSTAETVTFTVSETVPTTAFYIQETQINPVGGPNDSIYLSASVGPTGGGGPAVPEPSTLALALGGGAMILAMRRAGLRRARR